MRPFFASHRGLRGLPNSIRKKSAAGMAVTPSSHPHSPGNPARSEPITVPQRPLATVIRNNFGESWEFCVRAAVVPEITAVSNPKRRPPRAATMVLLTRDGFSFKHAPDDQSAPHENRKP